MRHDLPSLFGRFCPGLPVEQLPALYRLRMVGRVGMSEKPCDTCQTSHLRRGRLRRPSSAAVGSDPDPTASTNPARTHGPDAECDACHECPGCGGADGSTPKRSHLRVLPGVVYLICSDCDGAGVLCPNYVPDGAA